MPLTLNWRSSAFRYATQTGSVALTLLFANLLTVSASAHRQLHEIESKEVSLIADGELRNIRTETATVGALLAEQQMVLGVRDRCSHSLSTPLKAGMTVTITRIRAEIVKMQIPLPFPTQRKFSFDLPAGTHRTLLSGKRGARIQKLLAIYKDGTCTCRKKLSETIIAARPQIELLGTRGMTLASRGMVGARRMIEMVATGYSPAESSNRWGARTATGRRATFGVVAVDPRVIRLGTHLFVEGYGPAIAGDTGGNIKGNRIDLCHDTRAAANAVGRRRVRVLILD